MESLIDLVTKKALPESIVTARLKRKGCSLSLESAPEPNTIVDLDKAGLPGDQSRADFLFVSDQSSGWVVPIEMKKGAVGSVRDVVKQLQASTQLAECWFSGAGPVDFRAVLVSGSLPKAANRELKKPENQVRYCGKKWPVQRIRCGNPLKSALV